MKPYLDHIISEFAGSYAAQAQAKKLGLVKKPGFGMYGPPDQNIATHTLVDNGTRLKKMGSSGVGGDLEEGDPTDVSPDDLTKGKTIRKTHGDTGSKEDSESGASKEAKERGFKHFGYGTYGPPGDDGPSWRSSEDGSRLEPLPIDQQTPDNGGEDGEDDGATPDLSPKIGPDDLAKLKPTAGSRSDQERGLRQLGVDRTRRDREASSVTKETFVPRMKKVLRSMPGDAREFFRNRDMKDMNSVYDKFLRLSKSSPNPQRYLDFFEDISVMLNMADQQNAEGVQQLINKWGLVFEPKNNMYTEKGYHRAKSAGKVFDTGAAAYVEEYIRERTGIAIPQKSNLDPFSVQALVPSNPDGMESSISTRDDHTIIKFGDRTISSIPMNTEKFGSMSEEDKQRVRIHNMKISLMKDHLFKDGVVNGVVVTPEEGKLELTKSLKEIITQAPFLTDEGRRNSVQLIEDLENFDSRGMTDEAIKDVFNEFEGKFHDVWLGGASNERVASNALTPLAEAFSTLRETMLGETVIVPNDTNFPGTDIISIDFRDPEVASLIHVEVTPDITFGQVKRGSGAASSTEHKINTTIFNDHGTVSGDEIHSAVQNSIERTYDLLWNTGDVETATREFGEHFDSMWPIVSQQYGIRPEEKNKFLRLIQSGKIPVISRNGTIKLTKGANRPLGSRRRQKNCAELRQHWQVHNSVGILNTMVFNAQKGRQAINLHSHVIGKGIVETDGKKSLYELSPHFDKGLTDNCTPGTKYSTYSKVNNTTNENIMESIVHEFLLRTEDEEEGDDDCGCDKPKLDGVAKGKTLKDLALHHGVSVRQMSLELLKGTKVEKERNKDLQTAMKTAMNNLFEDIGYYTKLKMEGE